METWKEIVLSIITPILLGLVLFFIGGGDIEVTKELSKKSIFYLSIIICIGSFIYMVSNIMKNYSFASLGSQFDTGFFDMGDDGLKNNDYMKFNIDIRTDDASDDCVINGKYKAGRLSNIHIRGSGNKCSQLRKNNKL